MNKWNSLYIFYISGTGNIRVSSEWIAEEAGKKVYRGLYSIPVNLLISPVALGYYVGGEFFLSKTFIANYNCNNCGQCIKECPTSSIKMVGNRPYWKLTCESCMRCLNRCPQRAIEAAHGMATGFMILITAINTQVFILITKVSHLFLMYS